MGTAKARTPKRRPQFAKHPLRSSNTTLVRLLHTCGPSTSRSVAYDDFLIESLENRRRAKAYLNAALEDGDPRVFQMALRNVAQARTVQGR